MAAISPLQAGGKAVVTMLDLIAWSEGTSTARLTVNDGYDVVVTGVDGPSVFTDYQTHPFQYLQPKIVRINPLLKSTAAGRYQLLYRYFIVYKSQLKLLDFSPLSQDLIAIQQMKENKVILSIVTGNIEASITALSSVWASLPGNNYGQGGHSMEALLTKWQELTEHD